MMNKGCASGVFCFLNFYSIHEGAVNLHVHNSTILYMQLSYMFCIFKKKYINLTNLKSLKTLHSNHDFLVEFMHI